MLASGFHLYSVTALEAIVFGLGLLWLTTQVRMLAVLTSKATRPARRTTTFIIRDPAVTKAATQGKQPAKFA
ncbi:hypothetical protein [Gulosibacter sediminis]|uniref:hypothetical protein n=1 Tax=Gulosibacter sediminis TaxID=1729695 RepID=UPI0024A84DDD|nr:hypothetical protein [Gulosibacter sediminis]